MTAGMERYSPNWTPRPFNFPAILQRKMEGILQGITHVQVYLDDILVAYKTKKEHLVAMEKVGQR